MQTYDTSPCCLLHWEHNQYLLGISMNQSYPITRYIRLFFYHYPPCTSMGYLKTTWQKWTTKNVKSKSISIEVNWFSEWNWNRPFDGTSRWLKTSHDHLDCWLCECANSNIKMKYEHWANQDEKWQANEDWVIMQTSRMNHGYVWNANSAKPPMEKKKMVSETGIEHFFNIPTGYQRQKGWARTKFREHFF